MHEAGIIYNVLKVAEETARKQNGQKILKLYLRVGSMSGVIPEALQFAFEAMRTDTMAKEAQLKIENVSASCWCEDCKIEYVPDELGFLCPKCGGGNIKLQKGRELELVSIDYC